MGHKPFRASRQIAAALAAVILAGVVAHAQIFIQPNGRIVTGPQDEAGPQQLFVAEREMTQRLLRATQLVEQEEYSPALTLLQSILDRPEDLFFQPDREGEAGFRSLKAEAQQTVADLPDEGRRAYENEYGFTARQVLDEGIRTGDVAALKDVVRRFFHTEAGYEATYRLAMYHFDRGESLAAALLFDQLRGIPSAAAAREPVLTLRAALCWSRAGLRDRSLQMLTELKEKLPSGKISLGGREVPLFAQADEAHAWLAKTLGTPPETEAAEDSWALFRGNAARNGSSGPANPVWEAAWMCDTFLRSDSPDPAQVERCAAELKRLEERRRESGDALVVPAAHPLVVGDAVVFRAMSNVRAVSLKSGETLWESAKIDPSFELMIEQPNNAIATHNRGGQPQTPREMFLTQRAWRDLSFGTLSSDGRYVYSVEDLGFLGPFTSALARGVLHPLAAHDYNTLMAIEVASGKLRWELGGERGEPEGELAGAFFLGPPLPLDGRLYCLAEENGEIRLVAIDVDSTDPERPRPKVAWAQRLVYPANKLQYNSVRRLAGLSPSYGDGVMVCPTAAGATVAVDLTRQMLLWGYRYPTNLPENVAARNAVMWAQMNGRGGTSLDENDERWLDDTPTIADSKVLLTPRDSSELHCLGLADGAVQWKRPRGNGLYVATVHDGKVIVVGRTQVQAYSLHDRGRPAWDEAAPISTPSGRGVQVGHLYHLPLSTGEVATIDLDNGRVLARSPTPDGRIPGNLAAARGTIVSQSIDTIVGLQPLDELEREIEVALKEDPDNSEALSRRGELRLHRGDQTGGLADLRRAAELDSDSPTRPLLVAILLEGLRLNFEEYRKLAGEIEDLIDEPEQRARFTRLYAAGLQRAGEVQAAFDEYLDLAGTAGEEAHLEEVSSAVAVRSDRWLAARLSELYEQASPDQREQMDGAVRQRLDSALAEEGPEALRRFLRAFGGFPVAVEARRALIERLDVKGDSLELERHLEELRRASDPATSGWATAQLVSLLLQIHRPQEAAVLMHELAETWGDVACLEGKTGRQLVKEWGAESEVAAALRPSPVWGEQPLRAEQQNGGGQVEQLYEIEIVGPRGPYFEGWRLLIDARREDVVAVDGDGRRRWKYPVKYTGRSVQNQFGMYARVQGHLLAVAFGNYFVVFDALTPSGTPKMLWKRDLLEASAIDGIERGVQAPPFRPRGRRLVIADAMGRKLGMLGPITTAAIIWQAGTDLYAADPLTGETLWRHRNVPRGSELFGDDEYLFAVPPDSDQALVFRTSDGEQVGVRAIAEEQYRMAAVGRSVLSWGPDGHRGELTLTDALSGEPLWSHDFAIASEIDVIESDEVAVMEPEGRFVVLGLRDGNPRIDSQLERLDGLAEIHVRRSPDRYVLLSRNHEPNRNNLRIIVINSGAEQVNGTVYGFDRHTGRKLWATKIDPRVFDPRQPNNLPVLVLTAQAQPVGQLGGRGFSSNAFSATILDVRTGAIVYDEEEQFPTLPLEISVDPDQPQIDVRFPKFKIEVTPARKDAVEAPPPPTGA